MHQYIIFLHSQSPRAGHNFTAEVIRLLTSCHTPIEPTSEIPLAGLVGTLETKTKSFHLAPAAEKYSIDLFFSGLREKILIDSKTNLLIKFTSFEGVENLKSCFPDDLHLLLIRDPKDVLLSQFKAKAKHDRKSVLKRLVLPFGLYHFHYAKVYSKRISKTLPDFNKFTLIKYEALVLKEAETLNNLLQVFNSSLSLEEFGNQISNIKVINTSFYKEETQAEKLWEATTRTTAFNPINRKKGFNRLQLLGITLGCRSLRKKMNYI